MFSDWRCWYFRTAAPSSSHTASWWTWSTTPTTAWAWPAWATVWTPVSPPTPAPALCQGWTGWRPWAPWDPPAPSPAPSTSTPSTPPPPSPPPGGDSTCPPGPGRTSYQTGLEAVGTSEIINRENQELVRWVNSSSSSFRSFYLYFLCSVAEPGWWSEWLSVFSWLQ